MKALVTGGTGFIGSRVALYCRAQGDDVRVLARRAPSLESPVGQELAAAGITVVTGSITDPEATERACAGVDVVYHLAAAHNESHVPDEYFVNINVHGTETLLAAAEKTGVKRFIHASTVGVYGPGADGVIREDGPIAPGNVYGRSKLEGERRVREFAGALPRVILRLSETYGPADSRLLKLFKGIARGKYVHIGPSTNLHHPIYVDDIARAMRLAAEHPAAPGRTWVLAGPRPISTREMVSSISRALRRPPPRIGVPLGPLKLMAVAMEAVCPRFGIRPPLHRRRLDFFVKSFHFVTDEVRTILGFRPLVDFDEGVAQTAAWYQKMKML